MVMKVPRTLYEAEKSALTRHHICWHHDLGLPELQNYKKLPNQRYFVKQPEQIKMPIISLGLWNLNKLGWMGGFPSYPTQIWLFVLREHFTYIYPIIIKEYIQMEEKHRARHCETLSFPLWVYHHPSTSMSSAVTTQKPSKTQIFRFLWRLHYVGMVDEITDH